MILRKRLVRLHLDGNKPTLEGVLVNFWAGHYVLRTSNLIAGESQTIALDGPEVRVPKENVVFVQVLS